MGCSDGGDTGKFFLGNGRGRLVRLFLFGGWWERLLLVRLGEGVGTLLGPERTTVGCFFRSRERGEVCFVGCQAWPGFSYRRRLSGLVGSVRVVGWSFVENCTVDASIFVVKLSRANGGCLGTRSR